MNTTDEMMNTTEEMEDEVMSEETETTDLVPYEDDEDEEPSDGAVALTVLGIFGAGAAIGAAGKAIIDKIKAGKQPKQYNPEKPTLCQWLAIHLAPEMFLKEDNKTGDTPSEDKPDEIEAGAVVHDDVQDTPKEENEEEAKETTDTTKPTNNGKRGKK